MFTGLIEGVGTIKNSVRRSSGLQLVIQSPIPPEEIVLGESIAVDGVCLTVTGAAADGFTVDVSPESIVRSTLGTKKTGSRVNLERALRLSDRLGGHLVSGHIDGTAAVSALQSRGDFLQIDFTAPENILKYIIEKGSVALDGISLTVNSCAETSFNVMIIPHTFSQTTLADRKAGDRVNVENDIVGKYVEKFLAHGSPHGSGITREFLDKFNFT